MDAHVSGNWGWSASRSDRMEPADSAQVRAEHEAFAAIVAKRDDRLLVDVGLSRRQAEAMLARRTAWGRLRDRLRSLW